MSFSKNGGTLTSLGMSVKYLFNLASKAYVVTNSDNRIYKINPQGSLELVVTLDSSPLRMVKGNNVAYFIIGTHLPLKVAGVLLSVDNK